MKPKVLKKRLTLNKVTVVNLKKTEMNEAFGGTIVGASQIRCSETCVYGPTTCVPDLCTNGFGCEPPHIGP